MNKTLIYKEDAIKLLKELENEVAEAEGWQEKCDGIFQANQIIQKMDPVDAKPVLYALWDLVMLKRSFGTLDGIKCSHCGKEHVHSYFSSYPNYCSNCGAKMIIGGI